MFPHTDEQIVEQQVPDAGIACGSHDQQRQELRLGFAEVDSALRIAVAHQVFKNDLAIGLPLLAM